MNALLLAVSIAAALSVPALAQTAPSVAAPAAPTMDETSAVAAVDAAEHSQYAAIGREVPVEFAKVLIVMPYGSEPLPEVRNPTKAQAAAILRAKTAYWSEAKSALVAALRSIPADQPMDEAVQRVGSDTARVMSLSLRLNEVNAILADISADEKALAGAESDQALIERKHTLELALGRPARR